MNHNLIDYIDKQNQYRNLVSFKSNKVNPVHRWFPMVEGFGAEFVRDIILEQKVSPKVCLDPFSGIGTTALACQDLGIKCFAIENSPFFFDVTRAKLRADYESHVFDILISTFDDHLKTCLVELPEMELESKTFFQGNNLDRWIFDKPVANAINDILNHIADFDQNYEIYTALFKVALGAQLIQVSNVYRNGKCLSYLKNWQERSISRNEVHEMFILYCREVLMMDIRSREMIKPDVHNYINVHRGDSRVLISSLPNDSVDVVITSPPYLNSRDYTDIYRLELWIMGYVTKFDQERKLRSSALTSHVQVKLGYLKAPEIDELDRFLSHLEKSKTKLWNKGIPNMIRGYFFDMESILKDMHPKLKSNAMLYINVSNSAYGRMICEVDTIIAKIAERNGYEIVEIRIARYINSSKQQSMRKKLRESVIVLKKLEERGRDCFLLSLENKAAIA